MQSPMNRMINVRPARPDEAETVAALAARTFHGAFDASNDPAAMAAYVEKSFSVAQMRAELADPNNQFLLAEAEGGTEPVGYAKLRVGKTDPAVQGPQPIEIERIYAEQAAVGTGVGAALMAACLARAAAGGYRTVWLGVWELNPRAIAFYERWGFRVVGTHPFVLGEEHQTDLVMERGVGD